MGAGVAASPHFPWVDAKAGEGQALFPWRIGIRPNPCGSGRLPLGSPPRDIAAAARSPVQVLHETSLFRQLPQVSSEYRYSSDSCRARIGISLFRRWPFRDAFARRLRLRRTSFGKWGRFRLAPSPHASSSDRPSLASATFILADVRRFRGGRNLSLSFVSSGPLPTASCHHDSASRVAPSGILRVGLWITGIKCKPKNRLVQPAARGRIHRS